MSLILQEASLAWSEVSEEARKSKLQRADGV